MKLTLINCSKFFFRNYPMYHVTPSNNIARILENGLEMRNDQGICTVVLNDPLINNHLIYTQLRTTGETDFSVICISPQKHQLLFNQLKLDSSTMITNPLHLYIVRERIYIEKSDIVREIHFDPEANDDQEAVCEKVKQLFEELTAELSQ